MTAQDIEPGIYARRRRTLPVLCLSLAIVMVANGSLNVALPALARDLSASSSELQWMVDAYALVFAGLLFTAGALGDRFGRKEMLQGGLVLFLVGAFVAVVASNPAQVIASRAVMGLAAAFIMPSTLAILTNIFPTAERGRAISLWAGIAAGTAALGPPTSGFLLEHFWWGSVFLINVPFVVAALILGARLVPTSKDAEGRPLDLVGALLSMVGVGALIYAIIEAPAHGWASTRTLATFTVAAVLLAGFAARERTARHPMLDLRLFRDRRFSVASGGMALAFFAMFGSFFLVTQYLQLVRGYSALTAGLLLLPISLMMMVLAPRGPRLAARFGQNKVVAGGLASAATGLFVLANLDTGTPAAAIYGAFVPMVAGMAITMPSLTTLIMSTVPPGSAGVGSAMNDTTREMGGALGVAVLGSLLTTRYTGALGPALSGLPADAQATANTGLAGALDIARDLPSGAGPALADAARQAFVDGMGLAAGLAAAVVIATAAVAYRLLPAGHLKVAASDETAEVAPADAAADLSAAG
jgi:EmrB/QacA subfamily drug resistance transporter